MIFSRESIYIDKSARLIGNVKIGEYSSIWPTAVLRADMGPITLGRYVNIQDGTVIHTDSKGSVTVGDYTLVGHQAMLHGCTIGRAAMIGIRVVILDGAEVGDGAQITAGCMIRGGMKIPPKALVIQKNNELKIYENKARPVQTITGSLEYASLTERIQNDQFGPFSDEELKTFKNRAEKIYDDIFK